MKGKMYARRFVNEILLTCLPPLKFTVALSSFLWSMLTFWPGDLFSINREALIVLFGAPADGLISSVLFSENIWAAMFFLHSLFLFVTLFEDQQDKLNLLLADSIFGSFLWTFTVLLCAFAHYHSWAEYQPPTVLSAGITIALAQWWVLIRVWAARHESG